MSNKFPIEITADDAVIATIKRINDQLARLTKPIRQAQEYSSKLAKVAGVPRLVQSMRQLAGAAQNVAKHVASIAAPLTALIGGGTIAGTVALTERWAELGRAIERSARAAGMTAGQFQGLRGTAIALGADADGLGESFKSFQDILQGAQFGRNPEALILMNRLGIVMHRNKDGAIDTADAFKQLAAIIPRLKDPAVQRLVARSFGMEGQLALLRKGPAGLVEYQRHVRALGGEQSDAQLATASRLAESMGWFKVAVGGLQNEVGARLGPGLTQFFDHLTNWIAANRTRVGDFFQKLGDWLARLDFDKLAARANQFLDKLGAIVEALGGLKGIALGLGALLAVNIAAPFASLAASLVSIVPARTAAWPVLAGIAALGAGYAIGSVVNSGLDAAATALTGKDASLGTALHDLIHPDGVSYNATASSQSALDFFQGKGWTEAQSAGMVANLIRESSLNPNAVNGDHYGIGQWDPARQADFKAWSGRDIHGSGLLSQLMFMQYELTRGKYKGVGDRLHRVGTEAFSASLIGHDYEGYNDPIGAETAKRSVLAQQIVVHIHGAAPGTKVTAKTSDGDHVPVQIERTHMVGP